MVSKRADARYAPGRSKTWLKAKAPLTGDFVVAGFTRSAANAGLGALALGQWVDGELVYRGKVGSGFDAATLPALLARLEPLTRGGDAARRRAEGHRLGAPDADRAHPLLQPDRRRRRPPRRVPRPARGRR